MEVRSLALEGDTGTPAPSSLFAPWSPRDEQFPLPCAPYYNGLPHHSLKNNGANQPRDETSETISKNELFLFISCLSQVICNSNGS
jgi:hypothetical protein